MITQKDDTRKYPNFNLIFYFIFFMIFPLPTLPVKMDNSQSHPPSPTHRSLSPTLQHSYAPELAASEHQAAPQVVAETGPEAIDSRFGPYVSYYPGPNGKNATDATEKNTRKSRFRQKKIFGISALLFWSILALIIILILGLALGLGMGIGLTWHNSKSSSSDSSSSSSGTTAGADQAASSSSVGTTTTSSTATDNNNTQTKTTSLSSSSSQPTTDVAVATTATTTTSSSTTSSAPVTKGTVGIAANSCDTTTPKTWIADDGSTSFIEYCYTDWPNGEAGAGGDGTVSDILYTIVYTFEDCMNECVSYNSELEDGGTKCEAVTYNSNLTSIVAIGKQGGNCFLKNRKGEDKQGSLTSACAAIVD